MATNQRPLAADGAVRVFEYDCVEPKGARPQPETFSWPAISIVTSGVFGFRDGARGATQLLSTGSLLLSDPGRSYEVSHEHAGHDHCLIFRFDAESFDRLAGAPRRTTGYFSRSVLPPLPRFEALRFVAQRRIAERTAPLGLEQVGLTLAADVLGLAGTRAAARALAPPPDSARTRDALYAALARLEADYTHDVSLLDLARTAGLSPFHFLRSFKRVLGATPYKFLVRRRLRAAVALLAETDRPVTDIAYDVGFGDLSNFVNTFRREVGCAPGQFRHRLAGRGSGASTAHTRA